MSKKLQEDIKTKAPGLIKKLQEGDSSVTDEFALLLLPFIRSVVYKYKNTLDDDIDSVAGTIITRIISKIDYIDLSKSVIGFLSRSASNYCIDIYRKQVKLTAKRGTRKVLHDNIVATGYNFDVPYLSDLNEDTIRNAIFDMFCPSDATILSMYHIDNKSIQEIATLTGNTSSYVEETLELCKNDPFNL